MAKTAPNKKPRIPPDETIFYIFKLSASEYMLYDSGMGDPVHHGSLNLITSKLNSHIDELNKNIKLTDKPKQIYVYKLGRDSTKGWKIEERMNGIDYESPISKPKPKYTNPKKIRGMDVDPVFFWIDMGSMNYIYDMDMGSPLCYGSPAKIKGPILMHSKTYNFSVMMFQFPPKTNEPKWIASIKYNTSEQEQKKNLKDKQTEEEKNPKAPTKEDTEKDA
jgi:hypothetical protein